MADSDPDPDAPRAEDSARPGTAGSPTRGFLFADLREYTRYLEEHGAADAASLLFRYRTLVRSTVAKHDGAEIKTEGDSFYIVFPAVSQAVLCGLAIVDAAASEASDADARPIAVGIGIHAGETVETPDGFVGTAVNIAARLCAIARPGEVLVSDTVRALTGTVLPVAFDFRTRRSLKGIAEPMTIYAVARSAAAWAPQRRRSTRRRWLLGGTVVLAITIVGGAAAWNLTRPPPGLPPGPWRIGLDAPLTGDFSSGGILVRDAAQLAIDEINAVGGIGGSQLVLDIRDDTQGPDEGAANTAAFIADPKTLAMIGPWGSGMAVSEIPLTNAAGLLQCSPSNTWPQLTKPRDGALDLRAAHPDRINYIRTAPADDIQGPALASFVFNDLGAKRTLVIDDGDFGKDIADQFSAAYRKLGGLMVKRTLNPGADPAPVLEPLTGADAPTAVFFGGFTDTGAVDVRLAMVAAGKAAVPFVSWDDGRVFDRWSRHAFDSSFLELAGTAAAGSYFSHAAVALPKADFVEHYRARFHAEPDEYAAAAYACAQVIFESLRRVALTGPSASDLREAVRAHAVDTTHRFETVIGTIGFDANGDSLQQFVTFYRVDPAAASGHGDWVIDKQQDYGPAR
jgi:branched-chain amino acid transport system substrate-binding protein